MSRINKAKQQKLIEHLQEGGSLDKESLAAAIGATTKTQDSTFVAYLDSLEEHDEWLVNLKIGGDNPYNEEEDGEEEEPEAESEEEEAEEEVEEEEEEEPEPDPVPAKPKPRAKDKAKAKDKPAGFRFYLKLANGTSVEIEQTSKSDKIITFTEKPTTQVVSLMVKGEVIEVDLVPLRKLDQMAQSDYGMTNAKLLALALAAN